MDKEQMIKTIVDDLERWLKTDFHDALEHFKDLEQQRLNKMSSKLVADLYDNII